MAEGGQLSLSSFRERFDDQLTCSVCLDKYTHPKALPCHHSFCLKCIQQLPVEIKDGNQYINCPTCRVDHQLPQGGPTDFPNAFHIISLLDLRSTLTTTQTTHTATDTRCPQHNDPLKVFCETCSQVICRDCTISQEHNTHKFYLITECYDRHHQQIMTNLDHLKQKITDLNTAVTHLDTTEKEVLQQGQHIKEKISTHAQQLIQQIQTSQTHLSQQVDTIVHRKTQVLSAQKQQAQKLHTQLNTCQRMIEDSLKEWTQQQVLTNKLTMMDQIKTVNEQVDPAVFQPLAKPDIQFRQLTDNTNEIGLISSTTYGKATLKVAQCTLEKTSTATLTLESHDGLSFFLPLSFISSKLSSLADKDSAKCDITQTLKGKYNITFTPSKRHDQLIVQVGGVDIPDSPFNLPVVLTPEMRGEAVNTITGLHNPRGIAVCNNGDIVIVEYAHSITILNKEGKKVKSFGTKGIKEGQFTFPYGVAISIDGHILVTDSHRLQKLTTDGFCVKSVGNSGIGSGQLQFNNPKGITVNPSTGEIFVADSWNNRIQVFTNELTFSHTITPSGFFTHPFNEPFDVALDSKGYLYVAELSNKCITKLTPKGKYNKRFGAEVSAPGQLFLPTSLTVNNNLVYVSEEGNTCNRVSVFDANGTFLHSFGKRGRGAEEVNESYNITIDTFNNLYVSDTYNNRIIVY